MYINLWNFHPPSHSAMPFFALLWSSHSCPVSQLFGKASKRGLGLWIFLGLVNLMQRNSKKQDNIIQRENQMCKYQSKSKCEKFSHVRIYIWAHIQTSIPTCTRIFMYSSLGPEKFPFVSKLAMPSSSSAKKRAACETQHVSRAWHDSHVMRRVAVRRDRLFESFKSTDSESYPIKVCIKDSIHNQYVLIPLLEKMALHSHHPLPTIKALAKEFPGCPIVSINCI